MNQLERRTRIANRIINRYAGKVQDFWGDRARYSGPVTANVGQYQGSAANTSAGSGVINFDRNFLLDASRKDLRGAAIHELTHQFGVREGQSSNRVETAADYARYMLNPAEAGYWKPSDAVRSWAERSGRTPMSTQPNGGGPPVGNNRRNRNSVVNNASHGATGQGYQAPISSASAVGAGQQLASARYSYLSQLAALRAQRPYIRQQYGADMLAARQAGIAGVGQAESAGIASGMLGGSADLAARAGAVGQMKADQAAAVAARTQGLTGVGIGMMDARSQYFQNLANLASQIGQEQMANTISAFNDNGFGNYGSYQDYLKRIRDQKGGGSPRTRTGVGNSGTTSGGGNRPTGTYGGVQQ